MIWSFLLGRVSGYRPWWKLGLATMLGIIAGWFSPLSNLDAWFVEGASVNAIHAIAIGGIIFSVTSSVGLAYGLILRNWRAALTMGFTTSLVSVLAFLLTILLFDQFGVRVGGGNFAMSKVTSAGLMMAAIMGGAILGVGFSWFVDK